MSNIVLARKTGLSQATVSRFRNGVPCVSERATKMLQCAMRELGMSEMAPLRRQKCDGQIALIIAGAGESSLQLERLLRGASEAASANCLGLNLQVCNDSI